MDTSCEREFRRLAEAMRKWGTEGCAKDFFRHCHRSASLPPESRAPRMTADSESWRNIESVENMFYWRSWNNFHIFTGQTVYFPCFGLSIVLRWLKLTQFLFLCFTLPHFSFSLHLIMYMWYPAKVKFQHRPSEMSIDFAPRSAFDIRTGSCRRRLRWFLQSGLLQRIFRIPEVGSFDSFPLDPFIHLLHIAYFHDLHEWIWGDIHPMCFKLSNESSGELNSMLLRSEASPIPELGNNWFRYEMNTYRGVFAASPTTILKKPIEIPRTPLISLTSFNHEMGYYLETFSPWCHRNVFRTSKVSSRINTSLTHTQAVPIDRRSKFQTFVQTLCTW